MGIDHRHFHRNLAEFLLVIQGGFLRNQSGMVQILFQAQQNLVGVHGLDQIIGNFGADGFLHDVFFLAFGDHDHRDGRFLFLHFRKRFQAAHSRHVLVQKDNVEIGVFENINRVTPVVAGRHAVIFLFQE